MNPIDKLKQHFKDVRIEYHQSIHSPELGILEWIKFTTKNGYNINFVKRTQEQLAYRNSGSDTQIYGEYGFLLGGSQKFEGTLEELVNFSIKNYKPTI